jgi:hypothetical protein
VVGKACGGECYQNKALFEATINFGIAPIQGPYQNNDMSKICKGISSHQKNITSLYKMYVILKAKMDKVPFIKKVLTCYEILENLVK